MDEATSQNGIIRGEPEVDDSRAALVKKILADVAADKKKWDKAFKRMKRDKQFARKQLHEEAEEDDRAKVNIIQRHVSQRVATLYAKNPRFIAERRKTLDYAVWDGKKSSLDRAAMEIDQSAQTNMPPSPETMALMADIQQALARQSMLEKVGDTMEVLLTYSLDEQQPPFKPQAKQSVRRTVTCGVSYLGIKFQRELSKRPDIEGKLADITGQLANLERMQADIADGVSDEYGPEIERLRLAQKAMQANPDVVVREGLVFDFPAAEDIIPDRNCKQLAVGFPGARRVTRRFLLDCDEVKEVYGVDLAAGAYVGYKSGDAGEYTKSDSQHKQAMVYETYDRKDGLLYVTCEGYNDFLKDPAPPELAYLEPFFPWFPLIFNGLEDDCDIFPESDVRLLMSIQKEINRKREAIRQHRIANRPLNVTHKGMLTEGDAKDLSTHQAHAIIELEGLEAGQDVTKVFAPFPKPGVDPNLYETGTDLTDVQIVVGAQEANLGGTSGDSATENSIAEQSRMTSVASAIDDVDDWLSAIARASGQVLLREMDTSTVKRVAGPGAVWPQLTGQDIAEEVFLQIEAGSSGRPNAAQDLANIERVTPLLVQMPGMNPEYLLKKVLKVLDSRVNYEEAITAGLPSITSMNRQSQPGTGDPATDPTQQGAEGAENAPGDDATRGGAQPSYQGEAEAPGGGGAST